MKTESNSSRNTTALALAKTVPVLLLCLIFDLQIPRGYAAGFVYLAAFILVWNTTVSAILTTVILGTVIEWVGFFFSAIGPATEIVSISNRIITTAALWVVGLVLASRIRAGTRRFQSERMYRDLVETANSIILRWDSRGNVISINDFGLQYFGYSREELIGGSVASLIPDKNRASGPDPAALALDIKTRAETYLSVPGRNHRKDGSEVWVSWTNKAITDDRGTLVEILAIGNDITSLKRTEEDLREANATLEAFFDASPIPLDIFDETLTYVKTTTTTARYFGLTSEEIVGRKISELNPVFFRKTLSSFLTQVLETGKALINLEFSAENPPTHEESLHFRASYFPVPLAGGRRGVGAISVDITDMKTAQVRQEDLLRQSDYRAAELSAVIDSVPDAVFIGNENGITRCNARALAMFGAGSASELSPHIDELAKNRAIRRPDSDRPLPEEQLPFTRSLHGETVIEPLYATVKGADVFLRIASAPIMVEDTVIGAVSIVSDITDRKRAEDALRSSELRARAVLDSLSEGVVFLDTSGMVIEANAAISRILGRSREELTDPLFDPAIRIVKSYGTVMPIEEQPAIVAMQTGRSVYNVEIGIPRRDGVLLWLSTNAQPVRDNSANIIGAVVSYFDITRRKETEDALKSSEYRLKILNESLETRVVERTQQVRALSKALTLAEQRERKRFSQILHENLQQILFAAKMQVDITRSELDAIAHQNGITGDFDEAGRLIQKALRLTRTMAVELNPPVLDNQGLDAALQWLSTLMKDNYGLQVEMELESSIRRIRGETQIMAVQMVRELLNNVVQHAGVLEARVSAVCEGNFLRITVIDAGKGFVYAEVRKRKGTRVGLFALEERLSLFGGRFICETAPGKGTRCVIDIPVERC